MVGSAVVDRLLSFVFGHVEMVGSELGVLDGSIAGEMDGSLLTTSASTICVLLLTKSTINIVVNVMLKDVVVLFFPTNILWSLQCSSSCLYGIGKRRNRKKKR